MGDAQYQTCFAGFTKPAKQVLINSLFSSLTCQWNTYVSCTWQTQYQRPVHQYQTYTATVV